MALDALHLPATATRVAHATDRRLNDEIRARADASVQHLEGATDAQIDERLADLNAEWDVERVLQVNASSLVVLGVALGAGVDRRFLLLPAAVFSFLLQHALQGWCPPLPVLRRLGVRTTREIGRERLALKALRGDFDSLPGAQASPAQRARAVLQAVDR